MSSSKLNSILAAVMLTCASILCLFLFSRAGSNKIWFAKVSSYWDEYTIQRNSDATIEQIKEERWGSAYTISMTIKNYCNKAKIKNPVILFEPNSYLQKTSGFKMPEPIIFYYYTGLRSVWTNCRNVNKATHFISFSQGKMYIDSISSPKQLQQILVRYKSYPQSL